MIGIARSLHLWAERMGWTKGEHAHGTMKVEIRGKRLIIIGSKKRSTVTMNGHQWTGLDADLVTRAKQQATLAQCEVLVVLHHENRGWCCRTLRELCQPQTIDKGRIVVWPLRDFYPMGGVLDEIPSQAWSDKR